MSYVIPYKHYSSILTSDDPGIVKDALQQIFESLVKGKRFQKSKQTDFTARVECLVASPSVKVRKWAYHCACFCRSDTIFQKCKDNLLFESKKENVLWALTALSIRYSDIISLRQCVSNDKHEEFVNTISPNYLEDVLSLFTRSVQLDTRTIISQGNSSDLAALTKIYGYPSLTLSNYPEINADMISKLTDHDDSYVREYAYWSLYHGGSSEKYLLSSPDNDVGTRKWQIAIQFESGDFDFITSILEPLSRNPDCMDKEVKEGILKGLGKIPYSERFVPYIYGWYAFENIELICLLIVDYMLINCTKNRSDGTFFDALNDALTEDNTLSSYIKRKIINNTVFELEFKHPDANQISFVERSSTMPTFNIGVNQGQINASEGESSITATMNAGASTVDLQSLIEAVIRDSQGFSSEEIASIRKDLELIKTELSSPTPQKRLLDKALKGLQAIKGSAAFAASIATLVQFAQNYLK